MQNNSENNSKSISQKNNIEISQNKSLSGHIEEKQLIREKEKKIVLIVKLETILNDPYYREKNK